VIVFADSSALVKLYADEPGYEAVRALDRIVVSCLARVEVPAAIARKRRRREIGGETAEVLVAAFEADFLGTADEPGRFVVIGIVPALLDDAASLATRHGLRAYDAVQLASAMAARATDPICQGFACTDRALRVAAAAERFRLVA
jgi:predicted nucleic acid-binding protein